MNAIGLPIFNEEANIETLLTRLVDEPSVDEIVAVDDCSTDRSFEIVQRFARRFDKVRLHRASERSGQLAAWRAAAQATTAGSICFIDADAIPARGACGLLFDALDDDRRLAVVSGRTVPDAASAAWPAARFRAELVHRIRALQVPLHTIIGRFFATRRDWFLETALRSDIIANDAFLGGAAERSGRTSRYLPLAVCYYGETQTTFDFAAQRQRADRGYAQLRALGIIVPADGLHRLDYLRIVLAAAMHDPLGATAWTNEQLKSRKLTAYRASGKDEGGWEVQPSTKRRLSIPPESER